MKIKNTHYNSVHKWLFYKYGNANKCESNECLERSKQYDWSLIHGKELTRDRNNFRMLCRSCHTRYDNRFDYCRNGHKRTEENTFFRNDIINCRDCRRENQRKHRAISNNREVINIGGEV